MARRSLIIFAVMLVNAGCLITSTPQFTVEQHTAPFLVEATANPSVGNVVIIDKSSPTQGPVTFAADVVSQDDPTGAFSHVEWELYIDLGGGSPGDQPWSFVLPGGQSTQPGTLDQTNRLVSVGWNLERNSVGLGCHTATLVAAHNLDMLTSCPCPGDYSQITWQVLYCDSSLPGNCDSLPLDGCPQKVQVTNNCAIYLAELDAGTTCPANTTSQ